MKRLPIIIACIMLSLVSFAQLEIDYNYLNQQQKEIGSIIKADVEAQARQNMLKAQQNQTQLGPGQTQTRQGQTSQQRAIQDFNNRISIEGQQRMEYYNNPDNYIDRSITNRSSSAIIPDERYNTQNQPRDIRREPIHSENLTSKSLQMLREANKSQFSSLDEIDWDRPVYVKLFDEPSLGDYHSLEVKHDYMYRSRQIMNRIAREKAEREKLENEVAVRNDIIDLLSNSTNLVGSVILEDAAVSSVTMAGVELGKGTAGFLLSENINLLSEMAKYWNECSSGTKETKRDFNEIEKFLGIDGWEAFYGPEMVDSYEMVKNATVNSAIGKIATVIGDKVGVAYVGLEQMGTGASEVFTSLKIGFSLSNFAVKNEKQEE